MCALDLPKHISLYAALGSSKASHGHEEFAERGVRRDLRQHLGAPVCSLDLHYSKFNSSFGSGQYESVSLSKNLTDKLRLQFLGGNQEFDSPAHSEHQREIRERHARLVLRAPLFRRRTVRLVQRQRLELQPVVHHVRLSLGRTAANEISLHAQILLALLTVARGDLRLHRACCARKRSRPRKPLRIRLPPSPPDPAFVARANGTIAAFAQADRQFLRTDFERGMHGKCFADHRGQEQ